MKKLSEIKSAAERKKVLIVVAKELQKVCDVEPAIKTDGRTEAQIREGITEAGNLVDEDDVFTPGTIAILSEMGVYGEGNALAKATKPEKKSAAKNKKDAEVKDSEKKTTVPKKEKATTVKDKAKDKPKDPRRTRLTVMKEILHSTRRKGLTAEEMAEAMCEGYGGTDNAAKSEVNLFLRFLTEMELIEQNPQNGKLKYIG